MTALQGDPASCSQAGGSLRRLAARLRQDAASADTAAYQLRSHWSGRASLGARQRQDRLTAAVAVTVQALDRSGAALQEHATDLAEALQKFRAVQERAADAGLQVLDGRLVPAWGVSGVADAEGTATREGVRAALQSDLDLVLLQLGRRRARVAAAANAARRTLQETATSLRQQAR